MATTTTTTRQCRLEARITPAQKALIERAAALEGRTVTDFVVSKLQEAAREIVDENEVMVLADADRKALLASLMNPPKAGRKLREAQQAHRDLIRQ